MSNSHRGAGRVLFFSNGDKAALVVKFHSAGAGGLAFERARFQFMVRAA
jgi:hypothetical protein